MRGFAVCFASLCFGILLVYGQTTAPTICWDTTWYNHSAPTKTNRSDYETQPAHVLDSICTSGKVIAARCRDEKGEPFTVLKNDTVNHYVARCTVVTGLICNPYKNTSAICADFEIQYGCACPITPAATASAGSAGGGKSAVTSKSGSGSVTSNVGVTQAAGEQHGPCGNGFPGYGISKIMLISCMILRMMV